MRRLFEHKLGPAWELSPVLVEMRGFEVAFCVHLRSVIAHFCINFKSFILFQLLMAGWLERGFAASNCNFPNTVHVGKQISSTMDL